MEAKTHEKVYHFTKLNTAIEHILPNMQLRTNSLKNMNDPKENQLWAFSGIKPSLNQWYPDSYSEESHIEHQFRLGDEIKASVQLICFVKDRPLYGYFNEMMWAHYAENHRGICLEIDVEIFIEENQHYLLDNKYWFESVNYMDSKKPTLYSGHEDSKDEAIQNFIRNNYKTLFFTKSEYWEKENEIRLMVLEKEPKFFSIKKSLTGIYFGLSMPFEFKPAIDRFINSEQTKEFKLTFLGSIDISERNTGDFRPTILRKYLRNKQ